MYLYIFEMEALRSFSIRLLAAGAWFGVVGIVAIGYMEKFQIALPGG